MNRVFGSRFAIDQGAPKRPEAHAYTGAGVGRQSLDVTWRVCVDTAGLREVVRQATTLAGLMPVLSGNL